MKFPATLSALSLIVMTATTQAQSDDPFYDALTSGKANLDTRMRYENVDQKGIDKQASGLTLRTRLGYKTDEFAKTTAFIEMEDTRVVAGVDDFNSTTNGLAQYPVIKDPTFTELNQAYLSIKPLDGIEVIGGRQRIILDNARFIGNAAWRQNERTFDALTAKYKIDEWDTTLAYIGRVNGGDPTSIKHKDLIANAGYSFSDIGKLSGYYYGLDYDNTANQTLDTMGIRFAGNTPLGDAAKLTYSAEIATQNTDSNRDKSADYMLAELGYDMNVWNMMVGYEVLGSDNGNYGFTSQYGTNHGYNGWADKFLVTPQEGLEDLYIKGVINAVGMTFELAAHDYNANEGGNNLGSEINFQAVKPFAQKYALGFKYAEYSEGDDLTITDTTKYWLWGEMTF